MQSAVCRVSVPGVSLLSALSCSLLSCSCNTPLLLRTASLSSTSLLLRNAQECFPSNSGLSLIPHLPPVIAPALCPPEQTLLYLCQGCRPSPCCHSPSYFCLPLTHSTMVWANTSSFPQPLPRYVAQTMDTCSIAKLSSSLLLLHFYPRVICLIIGHIYMLTLPSC